MDKFLKVEVSFGNLTLSNAQSECQLFPNHKTAGFGKVLN